MYNDSVRVAGKSAIPNSFLAHRAVAFLRDDTFSPPVVNMLLPYLQNINIRRKILIRGSENNTVQDNLVGLVGNIISKGSWVRIPPE